MDKYTVKLYARVYRDIDGIYTYIAENLLSPDTALNMVDELEKSDFQSGKISGAWRNPPYRSLCKRGLSATVRKELCYCLSCAERKERGAYRNSTLFAGQFLK